MGFAAFALERNIIFDGTGAESGMDEVYTVDNVTVEEMENVIDFFHEWLK